MKTSSVRFLYGGNILFLLLLASLMAWVTNSNNPQGIDWHKKPQKTVSNAAAPPSSAPPQPLPEAAPADTTQNQQLTEMTPESFSQSAAPVQEIDTGRALTLHDDQTVLFIDARYEEDFLAGHIAGAINLPPDMPEDTIRALLADSAPERLLVLYCGSVQCLLSHELAQRLSALGRNKLLVYAEGLEKWREAKGLEDKPL